MPRRSRREVYAVRWNRSAKLWVCPQLDMGSGKKSAFVEQMAKYLQRRWKFAHVLCQLRVYGRNGRIQYERTYGADPRRFPG